MITVNMWKKAYLFPHIIKFVIIYSIMIYTGFPHIGRPYYNYYLYINIRGDRHEIYL
jgi:hypothetical protein